MSVIICFDKGRVCRTHSIDPSFTVPTCTRYPLTHSCHVHGHASNSRQHECCYKGPCHRLRGDVMILGRTSRCRLFLEAAGPTFGTARSDIKVTRLHQLALSPICDNLLELLQFAYFAENQIDFRSASPRINIEPDMVPGTYLDGRDNPVLFCTVHRSKTFVCNFGIYTGVSSQKV